jgi:hypothetical protein
MAYARRTANDLTAADQDARAALAAFEALGDQGHAAMARAEAGRIAGRRGDASAAREALDAAVAALEAHGDRPQWLTARLSRAQLGWTGPNEGDEGLDARALAEALAVREAADAAGVMDLVWSAEIVSGRLLADAGEHARAAEAFDRALQGFTAASLPHRAVEAAAGLARCRLAEGRPAEAAALAQAHAGVVTRYRLVGVEDPEGTRATLAAASDRAGNGAITPRA